MTKFWSFFFLWALVGVCFAADSRCYQSIECGPCRASIEKFAFNQVTGRCQLFTYGGCSGNSNNFDSLEECERVCA